MRHSLLLLQGRKYCSSTGSFGDARIAHCARLGQVEEARRIFDKLPCKSIVSWNSMIAAYFRNYQPNEAQRLFDQMPARNIVSWNGLLSGYVKNGMIKEAKNVFDKMPEKNVVSWTSMIRGYVKEGLISEAESLFGQMPEKNVVSETVMLCGLIQDGRVEKAWKLYDLMPIKDVVATTSMICGLCESGRVDEAREIFDDMPSRNVFSWTSMISGYGHNGKVDIARKLFEVMPEKNEVSWTAMLAGYIYSGRLEEASEFFDVMPIKSISICNVMIVGLSQNGEVARARRIFDSMREKDDPTWSAMVKAYERNGFELEALDLFRLMQKQRIRLNFTSLINVLAVCANLASLDYGRQIHAQVLRSRFDSDVYVSSPLITMYMKCGQLAKAKQVFDRFSSKDLVMWNSMITGYAQHGLGQETLQVFHEMCTLGVAPDDVTFIGVLSACSYTGKVKEGQEIFDAMESKYKIEPKSGHYACMVDLLGRSGRLNEAMDFINNMPIEADAIVWGSFMGACTKHMNLDLAEIAAKKLLKLEPQNSGPFVLLSNILASKGKWGDVAKLRRDMRYRKVKKSPGCSWIEVEKRVHMFIGGDNTPHPEHQIIVKMLEKLGALITDAGYVPDGSFVLHDVDEEDKVHSLVHHSEKMAVAYGLLRLPGGTPIRVMKNLRVCGDCHSAIKLMAKVTGREIILRDANRFHHFKDGLCSCGDYW